MVCMPAIDKISLTVKFSEPAEMTMIKVLQILRQIYSERKVVEFTKRGTRGATEMSADSFKSDLQSNAFTGVPEDVWQADSGR